MQSRSTFTSFGHKTQQESLFGLHLMGTQDEGMYGLDPEIHGRVSDRELCGDILSTVMPYITK